MKIRLGKIASWIGRALMAAIVSEAADRLARSQPAGERRREDGGVNDHPSAPE